MQWTWYGLTPSHCSRRSLSMQHRPNPFELHPLRLSSTWCCLELRWLPRAQGSHSSSLSLPLRVPDLSNVDCTSTIPNHSLATPLPAHVHVQMDRLGSEGGNEQLVPTAEDFRAFESTVDEIYRLHTIGKPLKPSTLAVPLDQIDEEQTLDDG